MVVAASAMQRKSVFLFFMGDPCGAGLEKNPCLLIKTGVLEVWDHSTDGSPMLSSPKRLIFYANLKVDTGFVLGYGRRLAVWWMGRGVGYRRVISAGGLNGIDAIT
jgi:hypothetical protein